MSIMGSLNIIQLKRPARMTPAEQRRAKLVTKLTEQREMAQAAVEGRSYSATKRVWARDENGNRVRVQREKRVTQWWFPDGTTADALTMVVKYGAKPIELAKGKRALSVANLAALPEVIKVVTQAVLAGELDDAIEAVANPPKLKLPGKQSSKA
jgi:hypothetical protein